MRHNPDRFAGFAVEEVDHDGVLAGFAAEEVDGVEFFLGAGVVGGDHHVGAVVDADDGLALVVAEVKAVDVVAAQDDGLAVDGWGFVLDSLRKADYKFFQVDGPFAGFLGTGLHAFFAVTLHHGESQEDKQYGDSWFQDLHGA